MQRRSVLTTLVALLLAPLTALARAPRMDPIDSRTSPASGGSISTPPSSLRTSSEPPRTRSSAEISYQSRIDSEIVSSMIPDDYPQG